MRSIELPPPIGRSYLLPSAVDDAEAATRPPLAMNASSWTARSAAVGKLQVAAIGHGHGHLKGREVSADGAGRQDSSGRRVLRFGAASAHGHRAAGWHAGDRRQPPPRWYLRRETDLSPQHSSRRSSGQYVIALESWEPRLHHHMHLSVAVGFHDALLAWRDATSGIRRGRNGSQPRYHVDPLTADVRHHAGLRCRRSAAQPIAVGIRHSHSSRLHGRGVEAVRHCGAGWPHVVDRRFAWPSGVHDVFSCAVSCTG